MVELIAPGSLAAFTAVSLLLCISPGPDNLFVLTQSALYGRSAGLYVTLGLCTGLIVHTAAVALGVAALIKASPVAFNLLKYAGAAYLLYLAWPGWCSSGWRCGCCWPGCDYSCRARGALLTQLTQLYVRLAIYRDVRVAALAGKQQD